MACTASTQLKPATEAVDERGVTAHTLWLGSAGTATAFGVASSVRAAWQDRVRIVAADINPPHLVAAGALADATEEVPPVADAGAFADALVAGLRRHAADTYVPLLVDEIALAARLSDSGRLPTGLAVLAPGQEAATLCADKLSLARRLEESGMPVPPTALAQEARWFPEGVVMKSRGGEGSRGVELILDERNFAAARARANGAIAQRRCDPPEVTVDAFRSRDGARFRAICRERVEVKAGVSTKARVFSDPGIEDLVRRVAEALGLHGALTVQAMRGPDGWELTDVNPRAGGGSPLSAAVGVDIVAAALADLWGEDPAPYLPPFSGEAFVVRHYAEVVRRRT